MQDEPKNPPAREDETQQLSEKDRSLACPIALEMHLGGDQVFKVGGSVKPPKPTHEIEATFSDEARKMARKKHLKSFQASSLVSLVVDLQGNPQNVCVQKPAGWGLDGQAVKAVKLYRFEPAQKDGSPVPVRISVEMSFRLY
jgi:TonB family protein